MGQSLGTLGDGPTVRDAVNTEEWMTEGCACASERILDGYLPQMRDILRRWKDDTNRPSVLHLDEYSTLVYKIAEELLGQCTRSEVEVFVHPGWCRHRMWHRPEFVLPWCLQTNIFRVSFTSVSPS